MKAKPSIHDLTAFPFTIRALPEADGGGYLIEYPDVPGCMSDGETPEESHPERSRRPTHLLLTLEDFGDPLPAQTTRELGLLLLL